MPESRDVDVQRAGEGAGVRRARLRHDAGADARGDARRGRARRLDVSGGCSTPAARTTSRCASSSERRAPPQATAIVRRRASGSKARDQRLALAFDLAPQRARAGARTGRPSSVGGAPGASATRSRTTPPSRSTVALTRRFFVVSRGRCSSSISRRAVGVGEHQAVELGQEADRRRRRRRVDAARPAGRRARGGARRRAGRARRGGASNAGAEAAAPRTTPARRRRSRARTPRGSGGRAPSRPPRRVGSASSKRGSRG